MSTSFRLERALNRLEVIVSKLRAAGLLSGDTDKEDACGGGSELRAFYLAIPCILGSISSFKMSISMSKSSSPCSSTTMDLLKNRSLILCFDCSFYKPFAGRTTKALIFISETFLDF
jgi:hypothetical protein